MNPDDGLEFFKRVCKEIEIEQEDERIQRLKRESERIASLILHTEYPKIDIDIETKKFRRLCQELFPDKLYLFDMIYEARFKRLWEQFREGE